MFCRKCGKEAVEKESYCTACGNSLSISSSTTSHTTDYVPQQVPKEAWSAGRVIKTLLLIAVVGGIIILKLVYAVDNTAVDSNNSALEAYESGESQQAAAQFQSASQNAVTNSTKVATLINLGYAYLSDEKII